MRSHMAIVLGLVALPLAVMTSGESSSGAGGFTELQRVGVAGASDVEAVMGLITKTGESIGAKHYHPGGEFGFVLEGAVTVTTESEQQVTHEAGASFYQPPGEWHAVSTAAEGAKTVVFRLLEKGQPMVVAVD